MYSVNAIILSFLFISVDVSCKGAGSNTTEVPASDNAIAIANLANDLSNMTAPLISMITIITDTIVKNLTENVTRQFIFELNIAFSDLTNVLNQASSLVAEDAIGGSVSEAVKLLTQLNNVALKPVMASLSNAVSSDETILSTSLTSMPNATDVTRILTLVERVPIAGRFIRGSEQLLSIVLSTRQTPESLSKLSVSMVGASLSTLTTAASMVGNMEMQLMPGILKTLTSMASILPVLKAAKNANVAP